MQIHVQSRGFDLTEALAAYAEQRLRFALAHTNDQIRRVEVRLSDINGPRGGLDKRCCALVRIGKLPDMVVEDTKDDLYVAIDRCADRAARVVKRRIRHARRCDMG